MILKKNCLLFYITSAVEIIKRLPLNDNIFKEIRFIDSNVALDHDRPIKKLPFLTKVFSKYININLVEEEWRQLPFFLTSDQKSNLRSLSIPEM